MDGPMPGSVAHLKTTLSERRRSHVVGHEDEHEPERGEDAEAVGRCADGPDRLRKADTAEGPRNQTQLLGRMLRSPESLTRRR